MRILISVLAAGESSRFNGEKLLCKITEKTVSEHVLDLINSLNPHESIVFMKLIVTNEKLTDFFKEKTNDEWEILENPDYKKGMSTSLIMAVAQARRQRADSILLFLSDMPHIDIKTVNEVIHRLKNNPQAIIRPFYESTPGFPVALPKSLYDELERTDGDKGASPVIKRHGDLLIKYASKDKGCIFDIDKREDIQKQRK